MTQLKCWKKYDANQWIRKKDTGLTVKQLHSQTLKHQQDILGMICKKASLCPDIWITDFRLIIRLHKSPRNNQKNNSHICHYSSNTIFKLIHYSRLHFVLSSWILYCEHLFVCISFKCCICCLGYLSLLYDTFLTVFFTGKHLKKSVVVIVFVVIKSRQDLAVFFHSVVINLVWGHYQLLTTNQDRQYKGRNKNV